MVRTRRPAAPDAARHPQERRAFLYVPLLALLITVVAELFNHKTFTEGPESLWRFVSEEPLAFLTQCADRACDAGALLFSCGGGCSGARWSPSCGWCAAASTASSCSTA